MGWPCLMCETVNTMCRAACAFCGSQRYTIDFNKLVSEAHAFIRVQLVNKPVPAYKRQASASSNGSFSKRSQVSSGSNNSDQDKFFMITELKCLKCQEIKSDDNRKFCKKCRCTNCKVNQRHGLTLLCVKCLKSADAREDAINKGCCLVF